MKICPKCGSDNVDSISFWDDSLWICKTCNYSGPVIEGDEKLIKETRDNYIKSKEGINETNQENESFAGDLIKICPRCGSDNVDWFDLTRRDHSLWLCETCGHIGFIIEGDKKLIRKIRENYIKNLKEEKEINDIDQENESFEENLADEKIEKKLDKVMETDFRLCDYEKVTEKLFSGVNSDIIEIFNKLNEEILSWNNKIKFKLINSYLIYSYNNEFLKISLDEDKINLQVSFNVNNPFDDYKDITIEVENENDEIIKLKFSLSSYDKIEYALFLIKQSYENNKKHNFLNIF
jgi:predicted transport protein/transposase-like protein